MTSTILAALLGVAIPIGASAEETPPAREGLRGVAVVVPDAVGKESFGGPALTRSIRKTLARSLGKLIRGDALADAQEQLGLKGAARATPEGLARAGKAAGARFVLAIEITEKSWLYTAHAILVDTETGKTEMDFRSGYYKPAEEAQDRGERIARTTLERLAKILETGGAQAVAATPPVTAPAPVAPKTAQKEARPETAKPVPPPAASAAVTPATTPTPTAAPPGKTGRTRIAVYALRSTDDLQGLAHQTTDEILLALGKRDGLVVIGESELAILLAHEKDKESVDACKDREACMAKLSEAADAEKVITGHLGKWGTGFLATLSLSDTKTAALERGVSASADSEKELKAAVIDAVDQLLGRPARKAEAAVLGAGGAKIAVLNLEAYDVAPELAENLTQLLSLELKRFEGVSVISRDEIKTMVQYETDKHVLQCQSDISCLVEIGGALGVDYLVSGGLGRLDDTFVIHLKLMDITKAEVAARVSESFRGSESGLGKSIRFATLGLLGRTPKGQGGIAIAGDIEGSMASVDGQGAVPISASGVINGLAAGKHEISVSADGYFTRYIEAYVEGDQVTKVQPELIELPRPWYKKWWAWTVIGSAVAGGVTAALLAANHSPDTGGVSLGLVHAAH